MVRFICKTIFVGVLFSVLSYGTANALPKITAKAWLVADDNGKMIEGINTKDVRSIASISKLMTAMVILDAKLPLDEVLTLRKQSITRLEVLQLAVTHSDNEAALLLCETYPKGYHACIHDMNSKADQLGMMNTNFIEPTGLSVFNVSTAEELVKLVTAASKYPEIVQASNSPIVKIKVSNKKKTFLQEFRNTNPLVATKNFIVSKTGFISKSGGCIVMMIDANNKEKIVVLLGSKNTHTRIPEAKMIALAY
mgnify:CR=1 FL=1